MAFDENKLLDGYEDFYDKVEYLGKYEGKDLYTLVLKKDYYGTVIGYPNFFLVEDDEITQVAGVEKRSPLMAYLRKIEE